ncbi:hypothetical protein ANN_14380 [Periplaneta americana]|uniref:Reverse transcriptase n=1 Tax=Periplaneta americana TaxID=6978 RepID=A0ABQ8SYA3_PERAM|nr:hypothetical protein ANN_14380 [Periplaneta americana]
MLRTRPLKDLPNEHETAAIICKLSGLSNSDWRDGIKMVGNVAAVCAVLGRSQDNRCRHCHNEVETLAHVLGSCPHDEGLRNARHHQVRSIIATALKDADYNTFEEVHGLSVTGSTRRIDIIAFKESTSSGLIIDPTLRYAVEYLYQRRGTTTEDGGAFLRNIFDVSAGSIVAERALQVLFRPVMGLNNKMTIDKSSSKDVALNIEITYRYC